jgi:ribosome-associated protein
VSRTSGHLADYLVVATARGKRQVQALAEEVMAQAKAAGANRLSETGRTYGWWVLIDFGDVVVHLMQPEARRFYDIDALYSDATVVRRSVDTSDAKPDTP